MFGIIFFCYVFLFLATYFNFPDTDSILHLEDVRTFWTGAGRVPPCGFDKRLTIEFYSMEIGQRRLPSSSTCALIIWLPRNVADPDTLWSLLNNAMTMSACFGKI